ncbi:MAG TPA: HAD family hydrolase [Patescibacteria group bacterium]|nr:HAD family hydrolase [Patescibacteria group bacterium]
MIRAVSFDLDDTLWPILPTILHAERSLQQWLHAQVPEIAAQWPTARLRAHRDDVAARHPEVAHDYSAQRRLSLREVLAEHPGREQLVEDAFATFYAARNDVSMYPDAAPCLAHVSARFRVASLSNGNADLERIGLAHHFEQRISARDVGVMKPDAAIFTHLCAALELAPAQIAHVGDDPDMDVLGAKQSGLFAIWLNRDGRDWPHATRPDLEVTDLHQLCAWLDAHALIHGVT